MARDCARQTLYGYLTYTLAFSFTEKGSSTLVKVSVRLSSHSGMQQISYYTLARAIYQILAQYNARALPNDPRALTSYSTNNIWYMVLAAV